MSLTSVQNATLKAAILADSALNAFPNTQDGAADMATKKLNAVFAPTFTVYKDPLECLTRGLGLVISYTALAAMTAANQQLWSLFYALNPENYDPSRVDIQSFMANIWSGALGGDGATTRAALLAYGVRPALYIEKIFAAGTGTPASPAKMGYVGQISYQDVFTARNS